MFQLEQVKQELERFQCGEVDNTKRFDKLTADHHKLQEYSSHQAKQLEQHQSKIHDLQNQLKKTQLDLERMESSRVRHFSEPGKDACLRLS